MNWFETWFDTPYYHILYKNRNYQEAETFIKGLTSFLNLKTKSTVIDLACGKGRHSIFLNKLGYEVLGLDLSKQSIEHNKIFENEKLKFAVHDMRNPIEGKKADAVFNLFTSFGYFETESDDKKVFNSVYDALKPKGFFVLDYLNQEFVQNTLEPVSSIEKDGIVFNIRKKIEDHYIIKHIDFEDKGQAFSFYEKVKLHTPKHILEYAKSCGFEQVKMWGNYDLSAFQEDNSPRCINLFRKK